MSDGGDAGSSPGADAGAEAAGHRPGVAEPASRLQEAGRAAMAAWGIEGDVAMETLTGGHINDSLRVTLPAAPRQPSPGAKAAGGLRWPRRCLLQRLNERVFPRPAAVMENVALVARRLNDAVEAGELRWRIPSLLPTLEGDLWHVDSLGGHWRLVPWLEGTIARESPESPADAREAARAYGEFLRVLADSAPQPVLNALQVTLPGFHDTRARVDALERIVARAAGDASASARVAACGPELDAVRSHAALADVLPPALATGDVPIRAVHNDAKMSNVLLDAATGRTVCVVDLDTVMPGSALHDFGDMVRSMVCSAAEDEARTEHVRADVALFEALAAGYAETAGPLLTSAEWRLLPRAGSIITLEQAARFLADHIEGDRYYRVTYPGQNLRRAQAQLALLASLEALVEVFTDIVERLAGMTP